MKDKSIKQPWPRSARITVWVMGIILAAITLLLACILIPDPPVAYSPDVIDIELPIEEPKEEDNPIIMPDIEELKKILLTTRCLSFFDKGINATAY